jgi:hypothetical protein
MKEGRKKEKVRGVCPTAWPFVPTLRGHVYSGSREIEKDEKESKENQPNKEVRSHE